MSKERKVLGRGLSALISQSSDIASIGEDLINSKTIYQIDINKIVPNANQPRKFFAENEINELATSISEHGILQPILVISLENGYYELIAGERRWQAAKKLGMMAIPAIIKDIDEGKSFEYAITENIQRQDLNPLEEARAYKQLIDKYGYTHEQLAKKLGKSRSYISNSLRILNLPDEIKGMIEENKISFGHARALINTENPLDLIPKILDQKLTVRNVETIVKKRSPHIKHNLVRSQSSYAPENDNFSIAQAEGNEDIIAIEKMLQKVLGVSARIISTELGGQIQINFQTLDELDNIVQIIGAHGLNF